MKTKHTMLAIAVMALASAAGAQTPSRVVMGGKAVTMVADAVYMFPSARPRVVAIGGTDQGLGVFLETVAPGFSALPSFPRQAGVEVYASHRPDLVILKSSLKKSLGAGLEALGIRTLYLSLETPDDYYAELALLGRTFGDEKRAAELIGYYQNVVATAAGEGVVAGPGVPRVGPALEHQHPGNRVAADDGGHGGLGDRKRLHGFCRVVHRGDRAGRGGSGPLVRACGNLGP
ncbi:MAG TPA: hypothetical protein PLW80_06920, partial [Spirochaetales bacterium]|nr:hypothetical protein [Spirochaetales bacterium]